MNGRDSIGAAFSRAAAGGRTALVPYLMAGLPDTESFLEVAVAVAGAGADVIEVGMPYSDPLADGPTIQRAGEQSLAAGMTLAGCLDLVARLTCRTEVPIVVMGYSSPILRYGVEAFCEHLAGSGGAGLIVADMPPEEADTLLAAAEQHGLAVVFLVAPTSDDARVRHVASLGSGFLYCVSLTGVTGARAELPPELPEFVTRVRAESALPVAVGFGIATPEQVAGLAPIADGVVVGSALVGRIEEAGAADAPAVARDFIASLAAATSRAAAGVSQRSR